MRKIGGIYLLAQAAGGAIWWVVLVVLPDTRVYFRPPEAPDSAILAFWIADLCLYVCGSAISGLLLLRNHRSRRTVLWFTTGAVAYASLYCLGLSLLTDSVWPATLLMLGSMVATLFVAVRSR